MKDEPQFDLPDDAPREISETVDMLIVPLWRARLWIVLAAMLGLGVGAFRGAIQPNTYDSVGKLLTRVGAREQGSAESRVVGGEGSGSMSGREAVANELHLLSNPSVFENVARKVGPARILSAYNPVNADVDPGLATGWMHKFQSWWFARMASEGDGPPHPPDHCATCVALAAQAVRVAIDVTPDLGSSVLTVTATTNSPELSPDLVDAFIAEALVHHQAVFSSESSLTFLEEQVEKAKVESTQSEEALADYRVSCGFYDAEKQRGDLLTDLNTLGTELSSENARLAALESQEAHVQSELAKESPTQKFTQDVPPTANPERAFYKQRLVQLRDDLLKLEASRDLTAAALEAQRSTLNRQIEAAQAELDQMPEMVQPGTTIQEAANPRYVRLRDQLDEILEESVSLRSSLTKHVERQTQLQGKLVSLERCGPALHLLETAAEENQKKLDKFLDARSKVGVLELLDSVNMINLRPLQAATFPLTKSGPKRGRLVLIGGLLGLACGIGLAFLRQTLDRRVRTTQDVGRVLGTPVLGVVPDLRRKGPRARPQPPEQTRARA